MNVSTLADNLQPKLEASVRELIANNIAAFTAELQSAEDGKLTVGVSMKLSLSNNRVSCVADMTYSRKFKDQSEFITQDPNQLEIEGTK